MEKSQRKTLSNHLDDKSVEDILVNLPVKSLVRFKCVAKSWKSFIEEDSSFIQSHLSRSKPQLVIYRYCGKTVQLFSPKNGFEGGEAVHRVTLPWVLDENVPRPINGLFCFIDESDTAARVYNLGTRQVTPWAHLAPVPLQPRGAFDFDIARTPTYGFGFHPSTNTYKLVYVLEIPKAYFSTSSKVQHICQVLTLGGQWRNIDEVPPVQLFESAGVYANGSIYWRNAGPSIITPPDEELIVAFDVGSEKFRVIQIPDFIVGPPMILKEWEKQRNDKFTLTSIDGQMAVIDRVEACILKLWISDDDTSNNEKKKITTTNWTQETISLPPSLKEDKNLYVHPVQGTDEIVIQTLIRDNTRSPRGSLTLNIYNRTNKSFRMIDITGITPLLSHPYRYSVHCVHESLVPVEDAEKQHMPMV